MKVFTLEKSSRICIEISSAENSAVQIAAENLAGDLQKVLGAETFLNIVGEAETGVVHREDALWDMQGMSGESGLSKTQSTSGESQLPQAQNTDAEDVAMSGQPESGTVTILVGTIGVSSVIEGLFDERKLQDEHGTFRKEAYIRTILDGRLVIAGTDRRGTIYGIYDFCEEIGVSPWYFWADVPVKKKEKLELASDYEVIDYPSVEYRGIFINDEEELEHWVQLHMGEETIGVRTYEKIFELLLRLKANYIWPAMHVNSFNAKKENGALADRMGIVVGTSHCDMLMRSNNREWYPWLKAKGYEGARYDYTIEGRNREILHEYWRESVIQNRDFEVSYTLGMRGIHDSGFETSQLAGESEEERRQKKIDLLQTIISAQNQMLEDELDEPPLKLFIPYKEVLELYDNGLEVPDDFTLVWANDNYGYIRRYPSEKDRKRAGGHGIYYHNSYWSPPGRSYLFLCSTPLAHTKYELMKAYDEGIQKLWILNVGAIKPLEMEVEFFLRLAWEAGREKDYIQNADLLANDGMPRDANPFVSGGRTQNMSRGKLQTRDVDAYVSDWLDRNFSGEIGRKMGPLINQFSQIANVRKLEMMEDDVFSQTAYGDEGVMRLHKLHEILEQAEAVYDGLPEEEKDAFFQLVLFRIHAVYLTMSQYYFSDRSTLCHEQGKMQAADLYAKESRDYEDARRKLLLYYNKHLSGGKWNGIVTPEDFPPPRTAMYPACTPSIYIGKRKMLVHLWNSMEAFHEVEKDTAREGHIADEKNGNGMYLDSVGHLDNAAYMNNAGDAIIFVRPGTKWFEIANGGEGSFSWRAEAPDWVQLSAASGVVSTEERVLVTVGEAAAEEKTTAGSGRVDKTETENTETENTETENTETENTETENTEIINAEIEKTVSHDSETHKSGMEETWTEKSGVIRIWNETDNVLCEVPILVRPVPTEALSKCKAFSSMDSAFCRRALRGGVSFCENVEEDGMVSVPAIGGSVDGKVSAVGVSVDGKVSAVGVSVDGEVSAAGGSADGKVSAAGGSADGKGSATGDSVRVTRKKVPSLGWEEENGSDEEQKNAHLCGGAEDLPDGFRVIRHLGREEGDLLEGYEPGAEISYPVYFSSEGDFLLEIHRFPSLNSVGRIRIGVRVTEAPPRFMDNGTDDAQFAAETVRTAARTQIAIEKSLRDERFAMEMARTADAAPARTQTAIEKSLRDERFAVVESSANDEWRGTWVNSISDNVDKLYLQLSGMKKGLHLVTFRVIDRYFAFSRFVIYTKERAENNLGLNCAHPESSRLLVKQGNMDGRAIGEDEIWTEERRKIAEQFFAGLWDDDSLQALPKTGQILNWADSFYGEIPLKPRKEIYASRTVDSDSTRVTDSFVEPEHYAKTKRPEEILAAAKSLFCEKDGAVKIDAVTAYAQTEFAYAKNGRWQYCGSESYARSGLAMYIRKRGQEWEQHMETPPRQDSAAERTVHGKNALHLDSAETAPSLNYQVQCDGGEYDVWVLLRIDPASPSPLGFAVDGMSVGRSRLYNDGKIWRYEAEQVWRWIPLTSLSLADGTHLLSLAVMTSGIRIDRIYLTRTGECPPVDCEW